jgi:tetratricopeptide (TPR) repeat protein
MLRVGAPLLCAVLLLLTLVAYLPLWRNEFVDFDDELYIATNPNVVQGLTGSGFCWAWTNIRGQFWMPVTWLSLQCDAQFFATWSLEGQRLPSPAAVHGQNLLWHAGCVLLLFGLLDRLSGARWRSFLVAGLFAMHPMHVESVAWAVERKDVLSVFFGLLTVWLYARWTARPGRRGYPGLMAAFAVSLLAKPMLLTLPFVLLLLDYWPLRRLSPAAAAAGSTEAGLAGVSPGRLVLEKVPLFALATAIGVITTIARERAGAGVPWSVLPLSARLANAVTAYGWYVAHTFWPADLAVLYPHPYGNWSAGPALAGSLTVLVPTVLAVWQARRRWLLVGWLWFAGTLVPVLGLAQSGEQAWADRFSYWPHIGLFVVTAWGLGELVERWRVSAGVCAMVSALGLACLGVLTWVQVGYWRNTIVLWGRALEVNRDNAVAHLHLGYCYLKQDRPNQAEPHFAEAVRLRPDAVAYRYFLGAVLLSLGRVDEAAAHLQETVERVPEHGDAWYNLGMARLRQSRPEQASCCFRKVLDLQPESADVLTALGLALLGEGKQQEALTTFRAALALDPQQAEAWHGLGSTQLVRGHPEEAVEAFGKALRYNPRWAKAYSDLGLALGRCGQWVPAVQHHLTAIRLQSRGRDSPGKTTSPAAAPASTPDSAIFHCRLAFALHQLGDRQGAARAYRAALARDPEWPGKFAATAWRLSTDSEVHLQDPRLAYELASQAVQATGDPPASMLDSLAAAQAALGKFQEAIRTAQQALKKASASGDHKLAASIRDHLASYENGRTVAARRP